MAWKTLSIISTLILLAGFFFTYKNLEAKKSELKNLSSAKKIQQNQTQELNLKKENLKKEFKNLRDRKYSLVQHNGKLEEKKILLTDLKQQNDEINSAITEERNKLNKIKQEASEITNNGEDFQKQLEQANQKIRSITTKNANMQSELSAIVNVNNKKQETLKTYNNLRLRQKTGIMDPNFTANVRKSYPSWGFIVINKGANQGVIPGTKLIASRNGNSIATVTVKDIEPNTAVASINSNLSGTVANIINGDLITVAPATKTDNSNVLLEKKNNKQNIDLNDFETNISENQKENNLEEFNNNSDTNIDSNIEIEDEDLENIEF